MNQRSILTRITKLFVAVIVAATAYVSIDFLIDLRPSEIHRSYRFTIGKIPYDQPRLLRQDNLSILLIKRSKALIRELQQGGQYLQDPLSNNSRQPSFADNSLRSLYPDFFVSYGNGTDLGCIVEQESKVLLAEICGIAEYDFAGRALNSKNQFQNLRIPDYNFSDDFKTLTIRP